MADVRRGTTFRAHKGQDVPSPLFPSVLQSPAKRVSLTCGMSQILTMAFRQAINTTGLNECSVPELEGLQARLSYLFARLMAPDQLLEKAHMQSPVWFCNSRRGVVVEGSARVMIRKGQGQMFEWERGTPHVTDGSDSVQSASASVFAHQSSWRSL